VRVAEWCIDTPFVGQTVVTSTPVSSTAMPVANLILDMSGIGIATAETTPDQGTVRDSMTDKVMKPAEIIDQARSLDSNELLVLRRVLDELVGAPRRQPSGKRRPFHTVPVDMGVPLVNIDKALHLASELDDDRILAQMGTAPKPS